MSLVKNRLIEKNCLFICFADHNIGVGHLFRSQILAKSLKNCGWTNFLIGPNISQKKIIKKKLFDKELFSNTVDQKKLLSKLEENVFEIIKKYKVNLVVIDSYLINNKFQKKIKNKLILKISNKKSDNSNCNIVLDYSFNSKKPINTSKYLTGPKYCLIENKLKKKKTIKNKKVLITFGGSNLLPQIIKTIQLLEKELPKYKLFVSTPSQDFYKILKKKISTNIKVILSLSLSKVITKYKFDFIISSAGHSLYELMANNYPSLFVGIYKNQYANIRYLKKTNGAKVLLYNDDLYDSKLSLFLRKYKKNNKIFDINKKISKKIIFHGSDNVAKILDLKIIKNYHKHLPVLQTKRLRLIPLSKNNLSKLYYLRKKSFKNKMSFKENNLFTKKNHMNWYKNYYQKNRIDYLIFEKTAKKFIGALHFKENKNDIEMGKYIAIPSFLGKKYGSEATLKWIQFGMNKLGLKKIIAITLKKNVININLNKKLGFKIVPNYSNIRNQWQKMIYK